MQHGISSERLLHYTCAILYSKSCVWNKIYDPYKSLTNPSTIKSDALPLHINIEAQKSFLAVWALCNNMLIFYPQWLRTDQKREVQKRENHERIFIFTVSFCCSTFSPAVGSRGLKLWFMALSQHSLWTPLLLQPHSLPAAYHVYAANLLEKEILTTDCSVCCFNT